MEGDGEALLLSSLPKYHALLIPVVVQLATPSDVFARHVHEISSLAVS